MSRPENHLQSLTLYTQKTWNMVKKIINSQRFKFWHLPKNWHLWGEFLAISFVNRSLVKGILCLWTFYMYIQICISCTITQAINICGWNGEKLIILNKWRHRMYSFNVTVLPLFCFTISFLHNFCVYKLDEHRSRKSSLWRMLWLNVEQFILLHKWRHKGLSVVYFESVVYLNPWTEISAK